VTDRAPRAPEILRAASRPALPWKNGGGVTREVAAFPTGSGVADFDWRVSIAEVRAAGPFSHFPAVDRRMTVLEGRLALTVDAQPPLMLVPDSPPAFFAGDVPASGEPLGGPVIDLNVMTRRGRCEAAMTRHRLSQTLELDPETGTLLVLALSDLVLGGATSEIRLARLDALRFDVGPEGCDRFRIAAPGSCYLIRIKARA
jgi:uncharacterized protein